MWTRNIMETKVYKDNRSETGKTYLVVRKIYTFEKAAFFDTQLNYWSSFDLYN